jgi:hypothetical protein
MATTIRTPRTDKYELGYLPKIEYWTNQLLNDNCDQDRVDYIAKKIQYFTEREKARQSVIQKREQLKK